MAGLADAAIRIDKWLWQARFFRSRALAAAQVEAGRVRVNGARITKPGRALRAGDVLTFVQGDRVRLVRVLAPGDRRGPAAEAQGLYIDLDGSLQPQHDRPAALE
ncbi:MAG: RNA-binding S4 domain-containing protein [Gemmobacter sp.]